MGDLNYEIFDTDTLLGVLRDEEYRRPAGSYWLDLCFPEVQTFDTEYIDFEKLSGQRKVAPLVTPMAEGRPIASRGEVLARVKPAYVKPADAVNHERVIRKHAALGELAPTARALTPAERYRAIVADIVLEHDRAVRQRWEIMAAEAAMTGKVILEDDGYPRTEVDFGRDAGHTIVKAAGSRWGDTGVDILRDIEDMAQIVRSAKGGGNVTRITVGTAAWRALRDDDKIREMMNLNYRDSKASGVNIKRGVSVFDDVMYGGTIGEGIDVYVYKGFYHDEDGNPVEIMDPRDVVMTSPTVMGIRAFGAIHDKRAGWRGLPIFPKMYDDERTGTTMVVTQSAPLMVPVFPNATLKATVVA